MARSKKNILKQRIGKFQNPVMGNPLGPQQAQQNAAAIQMAGINKLNTANQAPQSPVGMGGKKSVSSKYKNLVKK
jgi:hypothetical protein